MPLGGSLGFGVPWHDGHLAWMGGSFKSSTDGDFLWERKGFPSSFAVTE